MTTLRQAAQQALEALECLKRDFDADQFEWEISDVAITAIKAALEAKDEPFGFFQYDIRLDAWVQNRINNKGVAFYIKEKNNE